MISATSFINAGTESIDGLAQGEVDNKLTTRRRDQSKAMAMLRRCPALRGLWRARAAARLLSPKGWSPLTASMSTTTTFYVAASPARRAGGEGPRRGCLPPLLLA